ncbi:MAG: hypothetical protein ACFFD3_15980, partial [Candidatus Thorarchaeota archaeon]
GTDSVDIGPDIRLRITPLFERIRSGFFGHILEVEDKVIEAGANMHQPKAEEFALFNKTVEDLLLLLRLVTLQPVGVSKPCEWIGLGNPIGSGGIRLPKPCEYEFRQKRWGTITQLEEEGIILLRSLWSSLQKSMNANMFRNHLRDFASVMCMPLEKDEVLHLFIVLEALIADSKRIIIDVISKITDQFPVYHSKDVEVEKLILDGYRIRSDRAHGKEPKKYLSEILPLVADVLIFSIENDSIDLRGYFKS